MLSQVLARAQAGGSGSAGGPTAARSPTAGRARSARTAGAPRSPSGDGDGLAPGLLGPQRSVELGSAASPTGDSFEDDSFASPSPAPARPADVSDTAVNRSGSSSVGDAANSSDTAEAAGSGSGTGVEPSGSGGGSAASAADLDAELEALLHATSDAAPSTTPPTEGDEANESSEALSATVRRHRTAGGLEPLVPVGKPSASAASSLPPLGKPGAKPLSPAAADASETSEASYDDDFDEEEESLDQKQDELSDGLEVSEEALSVGESQSLDGSSEDQLSGVLDGGMDASAAAASFDVSQASVDNSQALEGYDLVVGVDGT